MKKSRRTSHNYRRHWHGQGAANTPARKPKAPSIHLMNDYQCSACGRGFQDKRTARVLKCPNCGRGTAQRRAIA